MGDSYLEQFQNGTNSNQYCASEFHGTHIQVPQNLIQQTLALILLHRAALTQTLFGPICSCTYLGGIDDLRKKLYLKRRMSLFQTFDAQITKYLAFG